MASDGDTLSSAADLVRYRGAVREWLGENFAGAARGVQSSSETLTKSERVTRAREAQSKLYSASLAGVTVPREYGGVGLTAEHERIVEEESAAFDLPNNLIGVSLGIIAPTLLRFGTEQQKLRYLPPILSGELVFIQLLTEPSGGSDLAGLLTRADRISGGYRINGQKCWSTGADHADFALCPARTDWSVPKHHGVSVFIVGLGAPGIDVREIVQIDGQREFCEEFLTDVVVGEDALVGAENEGWSVVRGLLEIEHAWAGRHNTGRRAPGTAERAVRLSRAARDTTTDPALRRSVAGLHIQIRAHELLTARVREAAAGGRSKPGYGSLLKISSDDLVQRRAELELRIAGPAGCMWRAEDSDAPQLATSYLSSRSASIGGGTREIHRNNVAEITLGLPREIDMTRGVPFDEVPHN